MAELTPSRKRPWTALSQNPVALKELRSRMRGRRAFVVLTAYLLAMSGIITLVYLAYASATGGPSANSGRDAGKAVFTAVIAVEVFLVIFIAPAFTAGSISGEKERQTFDLLRTTLISPRAYVFGKLVSALSYVLLLIFASIPLQSIAFLLGGLSLSELVVSQLLMMVAAVAYALWGLYCSSVMRTTLAASVATFAGAFFVLVGLPLIVLLVAAVVGPLMAATALLADFLDVLIAYGGFILASTNLPATLLLSQFMLLEEGTLFFARQPVGSTSYWLFSPWLLFVPLHLLAAATLFAATVRRVRRIDS